MAGTDRRHSIKVDENTCIGCVACMKACPVKAVRVRNRKAKIDYERCIDCGECLRVCAYNAVIPITTLPSDLKRFKYRVAIPSPVLYSQFGQQVLPNEILAALKDVGFDHVHDEALVCEMTTLAIEEYLNENKSLRPVISSTCPVVVRLIQRLFPALCQLIVPIEPPRETAAKKLRKEISAEFEIPPGDIGIFNVTSCSAKMVSISSPETRAQSSLDGAISIHEIYNAIMTRLKKTQAPSMLRTQGDMSGIGLGWAVSGGEIEGLQNLYKVAVSGVSDTIRILEDVESGKLKNIDYLECLICPGGCVGGPLAVENRFIAASNIVRSIRLFGNNRRVDAAFVRRLYDEQLFSFEWAVKPRPFPALAKEKRESVRRLKIKERMIKRLPGIDCGLCGAPDCKTLAEDIARGQARLKDCVILLNRL